MTEQQTAEARVIAEFMGYQSGKYPNLPNRLHSIKSDYEYDVDISHLKYHADWNWLMPVWHKFMTMRPEGDSGFFYDGFCVKISQCILQDPTPSAAASLLAQAITWIESLKK